MAGKEGRAGKKAAALNAPAELCAVESAGLLRWAISVVLVLVLVYPLALWLREAGFGGAAGSSLSSAEKALQRSVEAYQAGRYQEAIDASREALAENPEMAEAYTNIAVSFLQLRRYDAGIEAAEQALRLRPDFEVARNNLEWLQREKAAAENSGEVDRLMQEGIDLLYTRNDPALAVERFQHVLALNPEHYGANYQLAAALRDAGRTEEAQGQWLIALAMARAIGDRQTEALILPNLPPGEADTTPVEE